MSRNQAETSDRMSLRVASEEKSLLMRAAALQHTNLTEFMIRNGLLAAKKVIEENERMALSEKDSLWVMELLDNPPEPNDKLMKAAFDLPKQS